MARPTRRRTKTVSPDSASSFSARWISAADQPVNARLAGAAPYPPGPGRWIVNPGAREAGLLGAR